MVGDLMMFQPYLDQHFGNDAFPSILVCNGHLLAKDSAHLLDNELKLNSGKSVFF